MKKQVLIVISITLILTTTHIQAQWILNGGPNNVFGQLDNTNISNVNWTRSIGIGYFGANFTNSLLHVNSNAPYILPQNGSIASAGEVFRTDGIGGVTHVWRMLSNNGTAGDKFFIANPSTGGNNMNIGGVQGGAVNFYSNGGSVLAPVNMRFRFLGSYAGDGLIGLGDMGSYAQPFAPTSQLHQHRNGNNSMYHQWTNGTTVINASTTGITTLDGFKIGLTYIANPAATWVDLMQQEDAPIRISTGNNNIAPSQMLERMRFTTGNGGDNTGGWSNAPNATKITISSEGFTSLPFANPVASLNIGNDGAGTQSGGRRIWMDIGTYYSSNSDHMYTGLMDMGQNMKDAIINFGDDPQYNPLDASVQNLRFIFTQYNFGGPITDPHNPSGTQGLEIARMNAQGNMGIGPLFTNTMQPSRRLEIVDDGLTHIGRNGGPQLRLTHIQANAGNILTTGVWTDMQTTSVGNLYIHPTNTGVNKFVGINTANPMATLEITSNAPSTPSGLRFTNLTSASGSDPAIFTKFLTVNSQGDVILDDAPTSPTNFVTPCTTLTANYLTRATNNYNEICKSAAYQGSKEDIHIGYFTGYAYLGRLNINSQDNLQVNDLPHNIYLEHTDRNQTSQLNTLVRGDLNSAYNRVYGLDIYSENTSLSTDPLLNESRGGTFQAKSTTGQAISLHCLMTSQSSKDWAFWADGRTFTPGANWTASDSLFKQNIKPMNSALATLMQLQPKTYDYQTQKFPSIQLPYGTHAGLIAQDLEKVLPELVMQTTNPAQYDSLGKVKYAAFDFKCVAYSELIPYLIAGIQEQQTQITNLQNQINSCCPNNSKGTNSSHTITTKLTDIETIILDQNEPNPFAEETNISYFIPESAGKAEIMFYTNDGRLINKVEIKDKGQGTLHIYASDLSSGIYTYTLMVNGKVEETKRMMKSK